MALIPDKWPGMMGLGTSLGLVLWCTLSAPPVAAANGFDSILAEEEAQAADVILLEDEVAVFESIRMGLALFLAECDDADACPLSPDGNELETLVQILNTRVDMLTLRRQEAESEAAFDAILSAYVRERDGYALQMEAVEELIADSATLSGLSEEAILDGELADKLLQQELQLFEEDITDLSEDDEDDSDANSLAE